MVEAYPLSPLLQVRNLREDKAAGVFRAAENAVIAAEKNLCDKQTELESFQRWRPEEEARRYDEILGKIIEREELDNFTSGLGALGLAGLKLDQAVEEAKNELIARQQEVVAARQALLLAKKETMKISAHQEIWSEEMKREIIRQEDLELEEFKPILGQDMMDE